MASLTMPPQLPRSNSGHHFTYVEERELSHCPALVSLGVRGQAWSPLVLFLPLLCLPRQARQGGLWRRGRRRRRAEGPDSGGPCAVGADCKPPMLVISCTLQLELPFLALICHLPPTLPLSSVHVQRRGLCCAEGKRRLGHTMG